MKTKNELIIDRSKWRTGDEGNNQTGLGKTKLLNDMGFMCCLGFEMRRCGIQKKFLLTKVDPCDVYYVALDKKIASLKHLLVENRRNSEFTKKAIKINDNEEITQDEREKQIKEHFKKDGIKVKFTGKYVKP